ncbi:MAG TPA: hypothetical protein PK806_09840, partial [Saprospiraceae bacterium]|nr:hypothetical protein [Saprospiraceae bacterium]
KCILEKISFYKKRNSDRMAGIKKLCLLSLILLGACKEQAAKISVEERLMIDTMSANKVARLRADWIRDCDRKKDSMVQFAIDSLTAVTLEKINLKLKPYHE